MTSLSISVKDIFETLHGVCTTSLNTSLDATRQQEVAQSHIFANDLEVWIDILSDRPESKLYSLAAAEYTLSLLSLCQGQYRNAFKGLRLVVELCLQGIYLSANIVQLNEWLRSEGDTFWSAIISSETGIFSPRFCKAFFPEIDGHMKGMNTLGQALYRELSECTHGNIPSKIPLPAAMAFDEGTFLLWHKKAATARHIIMFGLCMRYLPSLQKDKKDRLESAISQVLGYIEPIRTTLESTATE